MRFCKKAGAHTPGLGLHYHVFGGTTRTLDSDEYMPQRCYLRGRRIKRGQGLSVRSGLQHHGQVFPPTGPTVNPFFRPVFLVLYLPPKKREIPPQWKCVSCTVLEQENTIDVFYSICAANTVFNMQCHPNNLILVKVPMPLLPPICTG